MHVAGTRGTKAVTISNAVSVVYDILLYCLRYEGQFSDGELNGYGLFKRGDGMTYCGQFKAGQPDGYGWCYAYIVSDLIDNLSFLHLFRAFDI